MGVLVSRDAVKLVLGYTTTAKDALIDATIVRAEAALQDYLPQWVFARDAAKVVYVSGMGGPNLVIPVRPVNAVSEVRVASGSLWGQSADPFPATSILDVGTYALKREGLNPENYAILVRSGSNWPDLYYGNPGYLGGYPGTGQGNIKLTLDCGFITVPAAFESAALLTTVQYLQAQPQAGQRITSETSPRHSYTLTGESVRFRSMIPDEVVGMLSRYRDIPI